MNIVEKVQRLIDDVISNEFMHEEYRSIENRDFDSLKLTIDKLVLEFKEILSPEQYEKLISLVDMHQSLAALENEYYFNRGVRVAFTNLSFLDKYSNVF
ncbi:hypothetical protein DP125_06025 [Clostridium tetani]|uniref:Uncharacterized protein n=1 Tax=Clostridium tetani TaxID=1513 RepID=A0A4Q0VDD3_CLOTA|nr:hypothetical protein [Clostridium tetani]RXI49119.1 hypothetical protein DP130_06835 [Clostridium tetani]RXI60146.1 hypothetical protein DP132_11680 [Clostridium tetani]RXI61029.1 hypothetical protein DP125_06025 [Clostridium tetani]RXI64969.1 hypothetical protein DP123_06460 [Clostridium tetani]RXI71022.1 hypothetical protein DP121_05775 [Clostridium tetani]